MSIIDISTGFQILIIISTIPTRTGEFRASETTYTKPDVVITLSLIDIST